MKKIISIIISAIFLFSSCSLNNNSSSQNNKTNEESSTNKITESVTYNNDESVKSFIKNPNKKTLIWLTDTQMKYEDDLNEYLEESGYDFYISFKCVNDNSEKYFDEDGNITKEYWNNCYQLSLLNAVESGADIIDTKCWFENSYLSCAEKKLLEPLDDYLKISVSGKKLYDSMPENYWQNLRYKGRIYGVDSWLNCMQSDIEIELNNELCKDLGIKTNDISKNYLDALDDIASICSKNNLVFGIQSLDSLSSWTDYEFITDCIYIDENGNAANIYESEFVKKLFNMISKHYNSGEFVSTYDCMNSTPDKVLGWTRSVLAASVRNGYVSSKQFGIETKTGGTPAVSVCNAKHSKLSSNVNATGIYSGSENKELAFEAICAFMNDEKFINTITYGKEYTINNGCADYEEYGGMPVGNAVLQLSIEGLAPTDRGKKLYTALESYETSTFSDFYFDSQKVKEQIIDVYNITSHITDEFVKQCEDNSTVSLINSSEYLEGLNKRLYDAGLQDILDEVNIQLRAVE